MDRKKILWLCSWYPSKEEPFNGDFIQRHANATAMYHDIHVIHVTNDFAGKLDEPTQEMRIEKNLTEQIVYFKKKKSITAKFTNHLRWLALYKRTIRNYIIKNGKPEIVHVHIPMKAGILGLWIRKNYRIPYIITEHFGIYNSIIENGYTSKSVAFKQLTKRIFNNASYFLSVSNYLGKGVNELVSKKTFNVIPNAVNTAFFFYKKSEVDHFRFIHVSNMVSLKNPEGILRSFKNFLAQNGKAELIMIGNNNDGLMEYARQLDLPAECCSFRGEISYKEVAAEMQTADCLLLFSNIENSPCVIGEALCCGLPVITTKVGGIPELVNATNAILITPKDEEGLQRRMLEMKEKYAQYDRKKIAEIAQSKFSYSVIGKAIADAYLEVLVLLKKKN